MGASTKKRPRPTGKDVQFRCPIGVQRSKSGALTTFNLNESEGRMKSKLLQLLFLVSIFGLATVAGQGPSSSQHNQVSLYALTVTLILLRLLPLHPNIIHILSGLQIGSLLSLLICVIALSFDLSS